MNPINNTQRTSIVKRIDFVETELEDLDDYKKLDFENYSQNRKTRRDVERLVENIANASIDIGKIILAGEDVELPETYKDIFIKLAEIRMIDKKLSEGLSDLVRLRNILAHQYLDIKWEMIKNFKDRGMDEVKTYLMIVKTKYLKEAP
jgi:uncharacterized protein YutE (UPF0331/DUF86 family)